MHTETSGDYDFVIVGQGLAGTCLAWQLIWRNQRLLIVDRDEKVTSSRVAAGLMTPITGQRLVTSWRWDSLWPQAHEFYRKIEALTGTPCLHPQRIVRLLSNPLEQEFLDLRMSGDSRRLIHRPTPLLDSENFNEGIGGFEMSEGGRLDVAAFLDSSRQWFRRDGYFKAVDLDLKEGVAVRSSHVQLPSLGATARRVIFCQGIAAQSNPWFPHVIFRPAKGEILTVHVPGLAEQRIVSRGVWLMPIGNDLFRTGATYDWQELNCVPTEAGREEICSRLREFLRLPFTVVEHQAAVRPILRHQYPALGVHAIHSQLCYFNGLGSKGSLQAPGLSAMFAGFLTGANDLDSAVDLHHYDRRLVDPAGDRP